MKNQENQWSTRLTYSIDPISKGIPQINLQNLDGKEVFDNHYSAGLNLARALYELADEFNFTSYIKSSFTVYVSFISGVNPAKPRILDW